MASRGLRVSLVALCLTILASLISGAAAGDTGQGQLALPPILKGYHGKRYKTKWGGTLDVTLNRYVSKKSKYIYTRGTWYDITKWAARTRNCDNVPSSVACMACAMNMPKFTKEAGVVPIAVADEFFGLPEKGATCSMCFKIYMPQSYKKCKNHETTAKCRGHGTRSYLANVSKPWVWSGKVRRDSGGYYFIGMNIEWFDRIRKLPYQITLPTQGVGPTDKFGDWPIKYKAVPCPVGKHGIEMQFLDFSKPLPVDKGICNNQFGQPCGGSKVQYPGRPLGYMKLMITSQRIPISAVDVMFKGKWIAFKRSGDGYWQPGAKGFVYKAPKLNGKLRVRISCANGTRPRVVTVIPGRMLCSYQNPRCLGKEIKGVQC